MCVEKCHVYFCGSERAMVAGCVYMELRKEADQFIELIKSDYNMSSFCAKIERLHDLGCAYLHLTDDHFIIDDEDISGIERAFKKRVENEEQ